MPKKLLSNPPAAALLGTDQIDDLAEAILTLTRELWVVADRQAILEKLLADKGVGPADIDAFQPDAAFADALDRRRRQLVGAVVGALAGKIPQ